MLRGHRLSLFVAMAVTVFTLSASAASAQVHVEQEHSVGLNETCPALVFGTPTTGGCHFEVKSEVFISLAVQTAGGPVTVFACDWHLEARVAEDGVGTFTRMTLTSPSPPSNPGCTRTACDTAGGVVTPWPLTIIEAAGVETLETTICLRTSSSGPGGAGTSCEVHLPWNDNGSHQYEIGNNASYSCENLPPVSIQNVHFINEGGTPKEDIEIVH
jgi:hypothetical protein